MEPDRTEDAGKFYFFQDNSFYSLRFNQMYLRAGDVAQWVEFLSSMDKIPGSVPSTS